MGAKYTKYYSIEILLIASVKRFDWSKHKIIHFNNANDWTFQINASVFKNVGTKSNMNLANSSLHGICLFNFTKESDQELECKEGDKLSLLCRVNSDWVLAKNVQSGQTGVIPLSFIEIKKANTDAPIRELKSHLSTLREWKYRNSNQIQELLTRNAVSNPVNTIPSKISDRGAQSLNDLPKRNNNEQKQNNVNISSAKVVSYERLKDNQIEYIIECVVNSQNYTLYRPYDDFFYMHLALKSAYPQERESNRQLPLLPVPTQNLTAYSLDRRLDDIDRYVKKLIALDHLKNSRYVLDFFKKQAGDEEHEMSIKIQILSKTDSMAFRTTLSAVSLTSLRKRISSKLKVEDFDLRDRFTKVRINSTDKLVDLINNNPEKIVLYIPSK